MQKPFRLEEATIDELHAAIKAGAITCVQIVQHYIARARAYNGISSALVTEDGAPIPPASGTVRAGAPLRFPSGSIDGTYARDKRPIDGTRSPHPALSHAPRFLDRGKDVPRPGPRERRRSPLLPCLILLWTPAWRADRVAVGRHRLAAEDHLCPALDRPFRQGPDQDGGVEAGVGRVSRALGRPATGAHERRDVYRRYYRSSEPARSGRSQCGEDPGSRGTPRTAVVTRWSLDTGKGLRVSP